jgi:hypothetical protein
VANVIEDYSKNGVPIKGPVGSRAMSNLSAGGGAPKDTSGFGPGQTMKGSSTDSGMRSNVPLEGDDDAVEEKPPGADWMVLARENFQISQNWFDISVRRRIEDNLAHAYGRHASGSKYYSPDYDKRSKYFRPKTRTMMRKLEAALALALFSTAEVTNSEALNQSDPAQVTAAKVHTAVLNHRLKQTVPWFKIALAGFFDAMSQGVVLSCQEWRYQEATIIEDEYDATGKATGVERKKTKITRDTPWVRLIPVENVRIHPSSDWADPINSSPYVIEQIPWFVDDLVYHIKNARSYGSQVPYLKDFNEQELLSGGSDQSATAQVIRQARETGARLDRYSQVQQGQHNRIVWVHRNIVRVDGLDYVYETLGTVRQLSDPVPLEEVFGISRRPYVMGNCMIEPHRIYPSGPVEVSKSLQEFGNDILNQRNDNIRLALNNRYIVKRGQMTDMRSLMRNVPGSITMTTEPTSDVKQLETKDVTSAAYTEQDRIDLDFGDVTGTMSQSTIGAVSQRDQKVRNTELLGQGADLVTELGLRTYVETWVQPVLAQCVELEREFENDQTVLEIAAGETSQSDWQTAFRAMQQPVNLQVSVGFGNTDPLQRIQRLAIGFSTIGQMAPQMAAEVSGPEVVREVMGILGYKDGSRFFPSVKQQGQEDPQVTNLKKQVADLQAAAQQEAAKHASAEKIAQIRASSAEKIATIKAQVQANVALGTQAAKHYVADLKHQIAQLDTQILREGNVIKQGQLLLEREALSNSIMQADREFQLKIATSIPSPQQATLPTETPELSQDQPFIQSLRSNGGGPMVPGAAGTIERGKFGQLPGAAG